MLVYYIVDLAYQLHFFLHLQVTNFQSSVSYPVVIKCIPICLVRSCVQFHLPIACIATSMVDSLNESDVGGGPVGILDMQETRR